MTEYGMGKDHGRRVAMAGLVGLSLLIFAALAWRVGVLLALAFALAPPLSTFLAVEVATRRVAEDGWAASLPLVFAHRFGLPGAGRHQRQLDRREERREFLGRLVIDGDVLRWEPREGDRGRGVSSVEWRRPWGVEITRLPGPGRLRCLTLNGPDGEPMDLLIRDPHNTASRLT